MSSIGSSLQGLNTKDLINSRTNSVKKTIRKNPFSTDFETRKEGLQSSISSGLHEGTQEISATKKERAAEETTRVMAEEQAAIDAEKAASDKAQLEKTRDIRKKAAARKGRRASIATSPLGDTGTVDIRRATLGG